MSAAEVISSFWFQAISWLLAALMYTLLGRFVLSFLFREDSQMVFWRVFVQITDPVVRIVRYITPLFVTDRFIVALAVAWLLLIRLVMFILPVVLLSRV
jgi:YggT family protein